MRFIPFHCVLFRSLTLQHPYERATMTASRHRRGVAHTQIIGGSATNPRVAGKMMTVTASTVFSPRLGDSVTHGARPDGCGCILQNVEQEPDRRANHNQARAACEGAVVPNASAMG